MHVQKEIIFPSSRFLTFDLFKDKKYKFSWSTMLHMLRCQDTTGLMENVVPHIANKEAKFRPREFVLVTGLKFGAKRNCLTSL